MLLVLDASSDDLDSEAAVTPAVWDLVRTEVPAVAIVEGVCQGASLLQALACPFRLLAEDARLGPAPPPEQSGPLFETLTRLEPSLAESLARLAGGAVLGAVEARGLGLTLAVLPGPALMAQGRHVLASLVSRRTPEQVRAIGRAVLAGCTWPLAEALAEEMRLFHALALRGFHEGSLDGPGSERGPKTDPPIGLVREGETCTLLLDDPPRNEMNRRFFEALASAVEALYALPPRRGLVLRPRGRHFSSGADLAELGRDLGRHAPQITAAFLEQNLATFSRLHDAPFPVVAALRGACLGSGLELALACGVRIAAPNALLALPEAQHGLMPGCGGSIRLARRLGRARALELCLSGRTITAPEALALGLVAQVVPGPELEAAAQDLLGGARA